ncbi:MAG: protein jag [Clostridia bacterium]|nr:protein jag [Clostridia bacterium]
MPNIEVTAKTLEEAKSLAAQKLGVSVDDILYEILENATNGIFGIGAKPCKISAWTEDVETDKASEFLNKILPLMGVDAEVEVKSGENNSIDVNIAGEKMGVVIGRRGETLDALQYLTSVIVNKNSDDYIKVTVDTENYRAKRTETLEKLANKVADKVIRNGRNMTLEPMNPFERRIIHSALQSNDEITTYSVGEEPNRKVVVSLANKTR